MTISPAISPPPSLSTSLSTAANHPLSVLRAVPGVIVGRDDVDGLETRVEISASALAHNLAFFRRIVGPDVELASVVKSNAYGHGRREVAMVAEAHGADSFAVHALEEALDLRAAGFEQDILIMGHVPPARLDEVVAHDLRLVVYGEQAVERLAAAARRAGRAARAHLKIETGTHRQGVDGAELESLLERLGAHRDAIEVEGVYTHFANIEDTTDSSYAREQLRRFRVSLERVERHGFRPTKRHAACSAAMLVLPETRFDMARLGIGQYGFWSSRETLVSWRARHGERVDDALRPAMTWITRVSQVKTVPADAYVGYGCSWQTTRETRLAILPVGYADGYDRGLSGAAHVLVRGRRAPVRGRVCMNLTMIDVTDIPGVVEGDEVGLLGRQGDRSIAAEDLASLLGTIHYEVVTRVAAHIPRLVVE